MASDSITGAAPGVDRVRTTRYFSFMVLWVVISAFNYGFGISELNPLQGALTCRDKEGGQAGASARDELSTQGIPDCVPMTDAEFGLVTATFTLGGLLASAGSPLLGRWGRKGNVLVCAALNAAGEAVVALAASRTALGFGRFVVGLGAGVGVCVVPIFLNEIAPPTIRGSIGVLNQLAIVFGIFGAQALGLALGQSGDWRWVPSIALIISIAQLALGLFATESPGWLEGEGAQAQGGGIAERDRKRVRATRIRARLWTGKDEATLPRDNEREGLLSDDDERVWGDDEQDGKQAQLGFRQIWKDPAVRPGLGLALLTQLAQQASGVNAVLYYSVGIMTSVLPNLASVIGLLITVVNAAMTFPPILLIDERRLGRKRLMILSALGMSVSSLLLGIGINYGISILSAICIVAIVASFSIGLGPVPFVIISELVPGRAVSSTTSTGLALNWAANFIVGSTFIPLRNALSSADGGRGGSVFFVFALVNAGTAVAISRVYRGPSAGAGAGVGPSASASRSSSA